MKPRGWLIPFYWTVGAGLLGYLAIASTGVGASPFFRTGAEPYDPQKDIFVVRETRHRLVGLVSGGAVIGFGSYWDLGQPEGVPFGMAKGSAVALAVLGLPFGYLSVQQPRK
jgi:hypothetical protein